ncbi:MerR family transcriptional regulator [Candidatus Aminicenantes bacterium AC-335-K20]|jgi:DNA-binding transcriptional MerR regulator|nr:MerR family transcriptional regulator [SCandidatus Aminicenantes bacterium Aminicenantia_JdfR_composite]MCP2598335.1 MerR family transcriptional regulator [Candidatus Aminicenantes bacterium AC-335-L06]MCP2606057.1 MerR family transcriptional regulator [Candidatus Aminicenantes bacterium AC-708-I09]MCP2618388.1 MerR family transcriptional regulator [Candidatus Aminicenantes bacterium AC-335-A11]MCP2619384.1 MerR family transcriptional regulator [Candidatus Aminicenantes bacterium AC-335-K20]
MDIKGKDFLDSTTACEMIGISLKKLSLWEKVGLIKPRYIEFGNKRQKYYTLEEIRWGIMARQLIEEEHFPLKTVIEKIVEARRKPREDKNEEET